MLEVHLFHDRMVLILDWKHFQAPKCNKCRNVIPSVILAFLYQLESSKWSSMDEGDFKTYLMTTNLDDSESVGQGNEIFKFQ